MQGVNKPKTVYIQTNKFEMAIPSPPSHSLNVKMNRRKISVLISCRFWLETQVALPSILCKFRAITAFGLLFFPLPLPSYFHERRTVQSIASFSFTLHFAFICICAELFCGCRVSKLYISSLSNMFHNPLWYAVVSAFLLFQVYFSSLSPHHLRQ